MVAYRMRGYSPPWRSFRPVNIAQIRFSRSRTLIKIVPNTCSTTRIITAFEEYVWVSSIHQTPIVCVGWVWLAVVGTRNAGGKVRLQMELSFNAKSGLEEDSWRSHRDRKLPCFFFPALLVVERL
jgi:hypothetical protein